MLSPTRRRPKQPERPCSSIEVGWRDGGEANLVAPQLEELLATLDRGRLLTIIIDREEPEAYWHWEEMRRRRPPEGPIPSFRRRRRSALSFVLPDEAMNLLHSIDSLALGRVVAPKEIVSESTRDQYLVSSLMEEAISSSLLEGAATTRHEAKFLLRSGREPVSRAERLVVNNYRTMQLIRSGLEEPLTVETVLDIHRAVTDGTLDNPGDAGRLQTPEEVRVVVVADGIEDVVYHRPPAAAMLPESSGGDGRVRQ